MAKSYRIYFTVDEELHELLEEESKNQIRKVGDTARYLMVKGMQAEGLIPTAEEISRKALENKAS
jgi:hypothetical protein